MKIYNTLSGKKELFKPIKKPADRQAGKKVHPIKSPRSRVSRKAGQFNRVNVFVCGMTVYDFPHIGHAKLFVIFDVFVKYLRHLGFNVFYLQNITDLDDKIIARAREKGVSPNALALAFEKEYMKSMKALGVNSVSKYARATDYIKEIISQIKRLQDKDFAYKIEGDGIYYDISKFKRYGKLSGRTALQAEDAVSRVDYSKDKKNRGDFCLWKFSAENEPSWKSPWGAGRPGWHIEDTAITEKFFGPQYDIHGGARELLFPHHEAEVSQMEAISGKSPLVKYWMHAGVLTANGQKMSKSLGNFITISDFLKRYPVEHLRFLIIKNLWSSPLDYSDSAMIEIKSTLEKIEELLSKVKSQKLKVKITIKNAEIIEQLTAKIEKDFYKQLDDNFNTPKAFAVLFEFIKKINKNIEKNQISKKDADKIYKFFEEINKIFGIINFKNIKNRKTIPVKIKKLAEQREKFRKLQNWQKSDEARVKIEKQGYAIEDTNSGPVIKRIANL